MEDASKIKGRALKSMDEAAARKKREQTVTQLCRSRREENLAKKRHVGKEEPEVEAETAGLAAAPLLTGPAKLANLHEYVRGESLTLTEIASCTQRRGLARRSTPACSAVALVR